MKKRMMAAIVAVAVMMFGTTAFAAGSPVAGTTPADSTTKEQVVAPTESAKQMADATEVTDEDITVASCCRYNCCRSC